MIITYTQMYRTDKYLQYSSIIWLVWLNGWMFIYKLSDSLTSDIAPVSSKEFLDIQATIEYKFTVKLVRDT